MLRIVYHFLSDLQSLQFGLKGLGVPDTQRAIEARCAEVSNLAWCSEGLHACDCVLVDGVDLGVSGGISTQVHLGLERVTSSVAALFLCVVLGVELRSESPISTVVGSEKEGICVLANTNHGLFAQKQ